MRPFYNCVTPLPTWCYAYTLNRPCYLELSFPGFRLFRFPYIPTTPNIYSAPNRRWMHLGRWVSAREEVWQAELFMIIGFEYHLNIILDGQFTVSLWHLLFPFFKWGISISLQSPFDMRSLSHDPLMETPTNATLNPMPKVPESIFLVHAKIWVMSLIINNRGLQTHNGSLVNQVRVTIYSVSIQAGE